MLFGRAPQLYIAAIGAIVALAVGFGLNWTGQQVALFMAATQAVLFLIANVTTTSVSNPVLPQSTTVTVTDGNGTKVKHDLPTITNRAGIVTVEPAPAADEVISQH